MVDISIYQYTDTDWGTLVHFLFVDIFSFLFQTKNKKKINEEHETF
jgi:hypothetical protein